MKDAGERRSLRGFLEMALYKTYVTKPLELERDWWVVDAKGQNLGRLASLIAPILRGKHKPVFVPNQDVGDFVIVNLSCTIGHDVVLENYTSIMPACSPSGFIHAEEGSYIGAGAIILPNIRLGKWSTIGAGAVVTRNVPESATVVGVPAGYIGSIGDHLTYCQFPGDQSGTGKSCKEFKN